MTIYHNCENMPEEVTISLVNEKNWCLSYDFQTHANGDIGKPVFTTFSMNAHGIGFCPYCGLELASIGTCKDIGPEGEFMCSECFHVAANIEPDKCPNCGLEVLI